MAGKLAATMTGQEVQEHLQALGLTQAAAAQLLGVSPRTMTRWCTDGEEGPARLRPLCAPGAGWSSDIWPGDPTAFPLWRMTRSELPLIGRKRSISTTFCAGLRHEGVPSLLGS